MTALRPFFTRIKGIIMEYITPSYMAFQKTDRSSITARQIRRHRGCSYKFCIKFNEMRVNIRAMGGVAGGTWGMIINNMFFVFLETLIRQYAASFMAGVAELIHLGGFNRLRHNIFPFKHKIKV